MMTLADPTTITLKALFPFWIGLSQGKGHQKVRPIRNSRREISWKGLPARPSGSGLIVPQKLHEASQFPK